MMRTLIGLFGLTSTAALGCPFCDTGGEETAVYLVIVFGLFMIAAAFVLFAAIRSGMFRNTEAVAHKVLTAERIADKTTAGKKEN